MTTTTERGTPETADASTARHGRRLTAVGLAAWVALVVVGRVWGLRVVQDSPEPLFVDAGYAAWRRAVERA